MDESYWCNKICHEIIESVTVQLADVMIIRMCEPYFRSCDRTDDFGSYSCAPNFSKMRQTVSAFLLLLRTETNVVRVELKPCTAICFPKKVQTIIRCEPLFSCHELYHFLNMEIPMDLCKLITCYLGPKPVENDDIHFNLVIKNIH